MQEWVGMGYEEMGEPVTSRDNSSMRGGISGMSGMDGMGGMGFH